MFRLLNAKKKDRYSLGDIYAKRLNKQIEKAQIKMKRIELGGNKKIHLIN